jgi:glutamyl/glutaminyl-tRNA synthetase
MLSWLDARSRGGRFLLRMEDIDPGAGDRAKREGLLDDLVWFGLTWDELVWQSSKNESHAAALDRLAATGLLYECDCSRTVIRQAGIPSAAGGWAYPGTCRRRVVRNWRVSRSSLRVNLAGWTVDVRDESGLDLGQVVSQAMGDPLVRRADGGVTYQLAVVVDDAEAGVTRVVRGRDLATSTATQVALRNLLGLPIPTYRHHLLLLEPQGEKLAKLHQSIGADVLRTRYSAPELLAWLAEVAGIGARHRIQSWEALVAEFSWDRVAVEDRVVRWDGFALSPG